MSEKEAISLTLTPNKEEEVAVENVEVSEEVTYQKFDDSTLSVEEKKIVDDFAKQIDITQSDVILQYGSEAQKKIAAFSDSTLQNVRTKDLGEVGNLLANLVTELKDFDTDEKDNIITSFFKKSANKAMSLKARYDKAEVNVDKISKVLEDHQITLLKDVALLDELYEKNLTNFKELTMYILAGQKKLKEVREVDLPALIKKAEESKLPEDSQAANDLSNACDRFEKKLYDLELTRNIAIQMAPQIRLVQNSDTVMTEKIQSTLVNTIPLWKSQMVIALGVKHTKDAMEAQREVTNMTNTLLKKNAETLNVATVEAAKEAERGIVDIETLKYTNQKLISTLDEVLKIQSEGKAKREAAQNELAKIEAELNQKLLEVRR